MQTFLPYSDFIESAKVLDRQRLGKQRVECWQIYHTICGKSEGWKNHPAVKMWAGYEDALSLYMEAVINEWVSRGYVNNLPIPERKSEKMPSWLGDERLHRSHRSALLHKKFDHYSGFGWKEKPEMNYYWPVR